MINYLNEIQNTWFFLLTHFLHVCILWLQDEIFIARCGMDTIRLRRTGRSCWTHRPGIQKYFLNTTFYFVTLF